MKPWTKEVEGGGRQGKGDALNDSEVFVEGPCDARTKENYSEQYQLKYHNGVNEDCRRIENPRFGVGEVKEVMQSKSL